MLFDTHCHLQFSRFKKNVDEVIARAKEAGVASIVIPGTDIPTSQKALEIANKYDDIYVASGIHPHHVYEQMEKGATDINQEISELETLLQQDKVVAVGEIGLDRHIYEETKYKDYKINDDFITLQIEFFVAQFKLAKKYQKSLIVHNRETKKELLQILRENWDEYYRGRSVFHCCEPDIELLQFAQTHGIFIGVDGDITYFPEKQEFIRQVPLEMLVLETDSPFLLPEPLRTQKLFPNEPKNLRLIAEFIAKIKNVSVEELVQVTTQNARRLFGL